MRKIITTESFFWYYTPQFEVAQLIFTINETDHFNESVYR